MVSPRFNCTCSPVALAVVEADLLPCCDIAVRINANLMVSCDHLDPCVAVCVVVVICVLDFVPFSCRIHYVPFIQIEEEAALKLIVYFPAPIRLVLGNELSSVPAQAEQSVNNRRQRTTRKVMRKIQWTTKEKEYMRKGVQCFLCATLFRTERRTSSRAHSKKRNTHS